VVVAVRIFGITIPGPTRKVEPAEKREMWSFPGGFGYAKPIGGPQPGLEQALCNSASYACIDVLVDHIAAAPWDAIRYFKNGKARREVYPAPQIITNPSGVVSLGVWKTQLAFAMVTDGNAFGRIVAWTSNAKPLQVEWVEPSAVTERKVVNGYPQVKIDNVVHRLYPNGDILHVPGRLIGASSPFAYSPLEYADKAIGTSLAAQSYTANWYSGGGHPSMGIKVAGLATAEQASQIKSSYLSMVRTGEPWVHGDGIEPENTALQSSPDQTAMEIVQQAGVMACQVWHVPPSWIYIAISGQNVTYANVTQADVAGLKDSVDPFYRRIEDVFSTCLIDQQVVRVNRDAVLKMDAPTRVDVQAKRLANKLMSVNEGREQEDEEPWPDPIYDEPGLPTVAPPAPSLMPTGESDTGVIPSDGGSNATH